MSEEINKILFISLSNIGDAIMTTPVLQALHERYPNAVIDIVGDKRSSEIFKHCPYRGEIIHKNKNDFLRGVPSLIKRLWAGSYDLIVDLRTDGLAYLVPARKRLTKRDKSKNRNNKAAEHSVEQHMDIISSIYSEAPPNCKVWISEDDETHAQEALGKFNGKKLLGVGPGANAEIKIWPEENYIEVINDTKDIFDGIVFLGDHRDVERAEKIISQTSIPGINLCEQTTILQAAAVQKKLAAFLGSDSGLGHLASATCTPSITVFGVGEPCRYRPWGEKAVWLVGEEQNVNNISSKDVSALLKKQALLK